MRAKKTGIPDPQIGTPGFDVLTALKEQVERTEGYRGDAMDRRPTIKDLLTVGIITQAQADALAKLR